jgi:hypothetical protein
MFVKANMKEVLNVMICHTSVDQYTAFNFPLNNNNAELTPQHIRSLHEFEQLYDRYQANPRRESLFMKVYAIETYALFAMNDLIIMATIAHNRTSKDISEICMNILEDIRADLTSHFILTGSV